MCYVHKMNEVTPLFMFNLSKNLVLAATLKVVFIALPVAVRITKLQPTYCDVDGRARSSQNKRRPRRRGNGRKKRSGDVLLGCSR